jgi:hypothetical protein
MAAQNYLKRTTAGTSCVLVHDNRWELNRTAYDIDPIPIFQISRKNQRRQKSAINETGKYIQLYTSPVPKHRLTFHFQTFHI